MRITNNGYSEPFFNIFIRDERKRKVHTSRSYMVNPEKLVSRDGNEASISKTG